MHFWLILVSWLLMQHSYNNFSEHTMISFFKTYAGIVSLALAGCGGSPITPDAGQAPLVDAGDGFAFRLAQPPSTVSQPGTFLVTILARQRPQKEFRIHQNLPVTWHL
jgi:hypothetical protein